MTENAITNLKRWLMEQTGLDPGVLDRSSFERLVRGRAAELGTGDVGDYVRRLRRDAVALEGLIEEFAVPETWFFRYPASFKLLVDFARQRRSSAASSRRLRMLSIACSTGEEPYSMAMAAAHAGWPPESVVVDAIDRSERMIAVARRGVYRPRSIRGGHPDWSRPWMRAKENEIHVDPRIVAMVEFQHADVLRQPWPEDGERYDVVFCRNLLIYLDKPTQKTLIAKLAAWLSATGLLFVGHAEVVESFRPAFDPVAAPHAFALRPRSTVSMPWGGKRPAGDVRGSVRAVGGRPSEVRPAPNVGRAESRSNQPQALPSPPGPPKSDRSPSRAAPSLDEARSLANEGRLDEALAAAEQIISTDDAGAAVYELMGSLYAAQGKLADAREAFTKVLYFQPHHEEALLQLSIICQQSGETTKASRYRQRAARSHTNHQPDTTP